MAAFRKPPKETTDRGQIPIYRRHGLTTIPTKMVSEVGNVSRGRPCNAEPFTIGDGEPSGEFLDVLRNAAGNGLLSHGRRGTRRTKMLRGFNGNAVENIITTILHALILQIWTTI